MSKDLLQTNCDSGNPEACVHLFWIHYENKDHIQAQNIASKECHSNETEKISYFEKETCRSLMDFEGQLQPVVYRNIGQWNLRRNNIWRQ